MVFKQNKYPPKKSDNSYIIKPAVKRDWSDYQKAIFKDIAKGEGHTVVIARAGSAKTSSLVEGSKYIPKGKKSLFCAFRQTKEELGFNPFQSGIRLGHKWTFVRSHTSRKTGKKSQSVIYVFDHSQSIDWFNQNFNFNKECSDIVVMPISLFIQNVEKRPEIFILPESMKKFAEQLKDRISI